MPMLFWPPIFTLGSLQFGNEEISPGTGYSGAAGLRIPARPGTGWRGGLLVAVTRCRPAERAG